MNALRTALFFVALAALLGLFWLYPEELQQYINR